MRKNKLTICFQARPSYDFFSSLLFKNIKKSMIPELNGIFITSDSKETKDVRKYLEGESDIAIVEVSEYFKNNWDEFTYDKFVEFEKKYDCAPLWKYVYMDRFLIEADYEYCVKITTGYFLFWEDLFKNGNIDYYYDEAVATLHTAIAYIVGCKYGVKYITQMVGRGEIEATHHFLANDPYLYAMCMDFDYKKMEYNEEQRIHAQEFLERYENHDIKASGMKYVDTQPHLEFTYALTLPLRYLHARFGKRFTNKYFYMYYKQYKLVLNKWIFYFRYKKCKKYYHKADLTKKYVYMALHFQPEASTIVCAQKYEKQLFFIDSWAKSLPADTLLYIKEHYSNIGHRKEAFYTALKEYPNVVLIDPWENSRELIIHAEAVTTLTGSVGWEGMLLRKPVIISGNVFYENAPGVVKVEDIYQQYLRIMSSWSRPSREEVIQYLCAILETMKPGNMYVQAPEALDEENMNLLSQSLYTMLTKIEENPDKYGYNKPDIGF